MNSNYDESDIFKEYRDKESFINMILLSIEYSMMRYIFPIFLFVSPFCLAFFIIIVSANSELKILAKIFFSVLALIGAFGFVIGFNPIRYILHYRIVIFKESCFFVKNGIFAKKHRMEWSEIISIKQIPLSCILIETRTEVEKIIMGNKLKGLKELMRVDDYFYNESHFVQLLKNRISKIDNL